MSLRPARRLAMVWGLTVVALLVVLIALGVLMRFTQAGRLGLSPDQFYALMTLHGLGMAGTLFMAGLAAVGYVASRYAEPSLPLLRLVYGLVLAGTVGLVGATLVGGFGAGWYILYPLPFIDTWPRWSTGLAIVSLLVLGVAWLLAQLDLLRAFAQRYGLGRILAWDYLRGETPAEPLPPVVLIGSVSCLAGALTTVVGAVLLVLYLFQWAAPAIQFDALLMKNLIFLFGHSVVNISMYLALGLVYEILPRHTHRPWGTNRLVALAWNATLFLVVFAYLHHFYMDFAQPTWLRVAGQIASYLTALPATVVTLFGAVGQVYRADLRWRFVPLAMVLGLAGWTIGGLAAVVDSTIAVNFVFHNTLWVPAHFHTYALLGLVLIFMAYVWEGIGAGAERIAQTSLGLLLVGGAGFVTMFYLGGMEGVPRRYASYAAVIVKPVAEAGTSLAHAGGWFALVALAGVALFGFAVLGRWRQAWDAD